VKSAANQYAIYFHCQTDLVETFRALYTTEFQLWRQPLHPADASNKLPKRRCAIAWRWH